MGQSLDNGSQLISSYRTTYERVQNLLDKGYFDLALTEWKKEVDICSQIFSLEDKEFAETNMQGVECFANVGNYEAAIHLAGVVELSWKQGNYGVPLRSVIHLYEEVGNCEYKLGKYTDAIESASIVVDLFKDNLGKDNWFYATALETLATYYIADGQIQLGIKTQKKVVEKMQATYSIMEEGQKEALFRAKENLRKYEDMGR